MVEIDLDTWGSGRRIKYVARDDKPTEIYIENKRVTEPTMLLKHGEPIAVDWAGKDLE